MTTIFGAVIIPYTFARALNAATLLSQVNLLQMISDGRSHEAFS